MHKFLQFDLRLNIGRLPLTYSLGDLSSIREIFTPEDGDVGRTQLPILPPISETISENGKDVEGYLVETSPALMFAIREFLKELTLQLERKNRSGNHQSTESAQNYVEARRGCINRIGVRLIETIKQERRLGLYNLFWLVISKHLVSLFDRVITEEGDKKTRYKILMLPIIAQTFEEIVRQVKDYFQKNDTRKRRYSRYIDDTITSHLGRAFNYEFSLSIIHDQIHLLFPSVSRGNFREYAQTIFLECNEKYHITYQEFLEIYSGVRTYIEKHLQTKDSSFCEMIANALKIPSQTLEYIPIETILFHPTVVSLLTEEIKHLPIRSTSHKKTLFRSRIPKLRNLFGEDSWEFAINDYLTFAKDLRRSEIIAFLRNRIVFVTKTHSETHRGLRQREIEKAGSGIVDKISYQFDKGRVINDLRNVTLIFLDLRGFTELSAGDIPDQALKEYLYNFFDPVVNIITHFDGIIKTYAGDGILASFGGRRDHALNAVRVAIEIQKFFNLLKQEGKIAFVGMGIGIHTGLVEETYFFPDSEAPSHNTVIGLTANLVGRLSSGKTEKKKGIDMQAVRTLYEYLQAHVDDLDMNPASLEIFEDRLFEAVDALQQEKDRLARANKAEQEQELAVRITSGVLNNNGIAISNTTFKHIHGLQPLQTIETEDKVEYTFFDEILQEQILLTKAGDATFKGIEGRFPVWGVYLSRNAIHQEVPTVSSG